MEREDRPAYFGQWIKQRRKKLDLTQAELARRAGCSLPALRKIESGERKPSKQLAGLLANSLRIHPEYQATFIKVARGELNLERLNFPDYPRAGVHRFDQNSSYSTVVLPFEPTLLIGREAELAALERLLENPICRIITLTGMGGIGKTRLAIEIAARLQVLFPDGVYFVSLASLNSPQLIVIAIADVLKLPLTGVIDPKEQLINHLSGRIRQGMLLILDNLEHLLAPSSQHNHSIDASVELTELLQRLPNLKVLVTSRERINTQGEWIFELSGLPFPSGDHSQLESYSAPGLFIQRARQVKANFELRPDERLSLAKVCELVEGTPLAIELAASWIETLSIDEIAQEIETSLDFLKATDRDIPDRHRSLRATFDHSWKLLLAEEQQVLSQLAVFRGGFRREAADHVTGASLPILKSLLSKSLLVRRESGRYDLHEVVRQYAFSHLTHNPQYEETCEKHYEFYLRLAQEQEKNLVGIAQSRALQIVSEDLDNIRGAMAWSIAQGKPDFGLKIASALGQFWFTQGYWREGLEWLERGLGGSGFISDVVRAKALNNSGWLSRYLGDYTGATAMLNESLGLWQHIGDKTGTAMALIHLGASMLYQGDTEGATTMLENALGHVSQQGNRLGMCYALEILGHAASRQGNSSRAIELYNAALAIARETTDDNQVAKLLNAIGDEYMIQGNYDRAEEFLTEAALICQKLGNRIVSAFVSANRGFIALKQGNYDSAFSLLSESLKAFHDLGDREDTILCLEPIASIALEQEFPKRAAQLLGASEMQLSELGAVRSQPIQADYDACLSIVRSQLSKAVFEKEWARGSVMTYEEVVAYAVDPSWKDIP